MTSSIARDPSPIRSAFVHGGASVLAFSMAFGVAAGAITIFGNADAAGPKVQLALFSPDPEADPELNPRLRGNDRTLTMANAQINREDTASGNEPSLGVDYRDGRSVAAERKVSVDASSQTAVRINGRAVLPGQSLSEVRAQDLQRIAAPVQTSTPPPLSSDTPFAKYALPFQNPDAKPTVSIIVGGLGINRTRTIAAIDDLPKEVTLSFAPTTSNLSSWVRRAREAGHEVVIEVPMEPYDYGRARPNPNVLRVSDDGASNVRRLNSVLSKANGYMGVINFQGDRFATESVAAAPVIEALAEKGVAVFQDGSLQDSVLPTVANEKNAYFGAATTAIDARPEADEIEKQLLLLEAEALDSGASLGTAMPFPISVDLLGAWIERLDEKGILLAPASHFARQSTNAGQIKIAELDPQG
ncbi:MAG: divergent polysaccharide deacetylase family protein [Pseudomonadota bacterium]